MTLAVDFATSIELKLLTHEVLQRRLEHAETGRTLVQCGGLG